MDTDHTTLEEYLEQIEEALKVRDYNTAIAILEMLSDKQKKGLI
jgi:hypothetical protein